VIYFIDRALATFESDRRDLYIQGLKELQMKTEELFPPVSRFSELTGEQQIAVLRAVEKTAFFEVVRLHTIAGFLANPEYGGNYDKVGWKLIGFDDKYAYEPPFGFYDRDYRGA
jgi:gluconate 2-dehydrogenase gamma chain